MSSVTLRPEGTERRATFCFANQFFFSSVIRRCGNIFHFFSSFLVFFFSMEFFECTWPPWQVALFVIGGHRLAPRRRNFVFFFLFFSKFMIFFSPVDGGREREFPRNGSCVFYRVLPGSTPFSRCCCCCCCFFDNLEIAAARRLMAKKTPNSVKVVR